MSESQDRSARKWAGALIRSEARGLPTIYLTRQQKPERVVPQVYLCEGDGHGITARLKWIASTCLAGTVGLCLIGIAVYASMNMEDGSGMMSSIKRAGLAALRPMQSATIARDGGQSPTALKGDRIQTTSAGFVSRQLIHETVVQRQGSREFITIKPYVRLVVGLSTEHPANEASIPAFNPFKLYSDDTPIGASESDPSDRRFSYHVMDMPLDPIGDDGIELGREEVTRLVAEAAENYAYTDKAVDLRETASLGNDSSLQRASYRPDGDPAAGPLARNLTIIRKVEEEEEEEEPGNGVLPGSEIKEVKVKSGDSLLGIISKVGADKAQAQAIVTAMKPVFSPEKLDVKQQLRFTLVPTPSDTGQMDIDRVSIFGEKEKHLATVARTKGGDYVGSDQYVDGATLEAMRKAEEERAAEAREADKRVTLYKSFYDAASKQHLSPDVIEKLLRIHSYDVDFKLKVRPGDSFEAFVDMPEDADLDEEETAEGGELLYTSMTVNNVTRSFYRFRTPDGVVDYYDEKGNSAKKFLMRNPVRGGRYTSGFGARKHPLLGVMRRHNGVDWAAPSGTAILAGGDGVVESVGRNGAYGNYIRIRHANGFATAYGHLSKFADKLQDGVRVRQGQVIGYVGSTGLSTGPHCHYEVLVNNEFVNPMTIQVPRGLQLTGRQLAEFEKERGRIEALMQLDPVTTRVADAIR